MTKGEYFKANREVLLALFKLIGIIATSIIAILFIVTGFHLKSLLDVFYLFLTCSILGNIIAFSITLMYFTLNYNPFKDQTLFFNTINNELKNKLNIKLYYQPIYHKYDLLEIKMFSDYEGYLFCIQCDRSEKLIKTIIVKQATDRNEYELSGKHIDQKYKNDFMGYTPLGLQKVIKYKKWSEIHFLDIELIFEELLKVCSKEGLKVIIQNRKVE